MKYKCECIKTTKWVELCKNCIQLKKTALNSLFPKMVDWIHKKMNASDELGMWVNQNYGMYLIVHKLYSIKTNKCNYLSVTDDGWLNRRNNECDWWSMNMSALKLWNESNCTKNVFNQNRKLLLPFCFQWCSIELTKKWMWLMKYECECIENMEWVRSYRHCIQSKQTYALTFLFLTKVN